MEKYYLALDIGGTKTSAALFTKEGRIYRDYVLTMKSETFKGEEAVYQNTKRVLGKLLAETGTAKDAVEGIGVGSPGPLDTRRGLILHAPLMGWRNFPIVERLKEDFRKPVLLDNDGNLGGLAEVRSGVGRGAGHLIYMTVSTGCGSGVIIDGDIYRGHRDGAGELGHMSLFPEGRPCPCGSKGCFELYASGTALNRRMREDMERGRKSLAFEFAEYEKEKIEGRHLSEAAARGDAYALELYREEGYYLGLGIANLFNLFDPEVIVLGGGVSKAKEFFHESLMETLRKRCIQRIGEDALRYSKLNDRVVLYGAYHLIRDHLERNRGEFSPQ